MKGLYILFIAIAIIGVHSQGNDNIIPAPSTVSPPRAPCASGESRVAHEIDCNAYYDCISGRKSGVQHCPENTVFNPYLEACDYKWNVDCKGKLNGGM